MAFFILIKQLCNRIKQFIEAVAREKESLERGKRRRQIERESANMAPSMMGPAEGLRDFESSTVMQ